MLETTDGELLQEEVEHEKGPFPSQILTVKRKDGRFAFCRSLLDGRNFYTFQWTGALNDENNSSAAAQEQAPAKTVQQKFTQDLEKQFSSGRRLAIVIGIDAYPTMLLKCCVKDARLLAEMQ